MSELKKDLLVQIISGIIVAIITAIATGIVTNYFTQKGIIEAISVRFDSVDSNMSYEQALQLVYEDMEQMKANNFTLQKRIDESNDSYAALQLENNSLQSEIDSLKNTISCTEQIVLAESYASSGKYEIAIPILNEINEKSEDVNALLKEYKNNYETLVISNAESLAHNGNYDEAITLIEEALKVIPDSQILHDKKKNVTPQYLVDTIECYKAENLWLLDSKEYIKMSGKSYRHAIFSKSSDIGVTMFNNAYSASAFYNLDGTYSQLSGTIGHIDFSGSGTIGENDSGQVYDAEITIWGDNKEIYTIVLSANDMAQSFNIPIEGVNKLEFRIKCNGNSSVGIAEIQIR